jgi:hypothetical protein
MDQCGRERVCAGGVAEQELIERFRITLRDSGRIRHKRWQTTAQGLVCGKTIRLIAGRGDQGIAGGEDPRDVRAEAEEGDSTGNSIALGSYLPRWELGATTDDDELRVPRLRSTEGAPCVVDDVESFPAITQSPDKRNPGPPALASQQAPSDRTLGHSDRMKARTIRRQVDGRNQIGPHTHSLDHVSSGSLRIGYNDSRCAQSSPFADAVTGMRGESRRCT